MIPLNEEVSKFGRRTATVSGRSQLYCFPDSFLEVAVLGFPGYR
jgi:hypothetical protein